MIATSTPEAKPAAAVCDSIAWGAERAVLAHLLDQHPRRLTIEELCRQFAGLLSDASVEEAADNLVAARFLIRENTDLLPAPAVVAFDRSTPATHF
jgi:hypothetical protein